MEKSDPIPSHYAEAIANGFFWECDCGEIHRTEQGARNCRKCRDYLMENDFYNRADPVDIRKFFP